MPHFKGVDVRVTTGDDKPLPEYGHQQFSRMKTTSCNIEATTGLQFSIQITLDDPFPNCEESSMTSTARIDRASDSKDGSRNKRISTQKASGTEQSKSPKPVDFHLMAKVYIDGRKKCEQSCMLYLDNTHLEYLPKTVLACRFVQEGDGTVGRRVWVFTDVGVGAVSEMMGALEMTKESSATVSKQSDKDVDNLSTLLGKSALNGAGKILVEIKRVTLERVEGGWKPRFKAGEDEKLDDEDINLGKDVTHITKVDHGQTQQTRPKYRLFVGSLEGKDGVYARFEFHYVSRLRLLALNMMDKHGKAIDRQDWNISSGKSTAGEKRPKDRLEGANQASRDQATTTSSKGVRRSSPITKQSVA